MTLTPAMFAILLALHASPRHGYALMDDVTVLTDGAIALGPATLYRSLQRLRVDGLIEELDEDQPAGTPVDRRAERRRSYRITVAGRSAATDEAQRLAVMVAAARRIGILAESKRSAS
jgi:DNA-binding PadR family transcriptional regulator